MDFIPIYQFLPGMIWPENRPPLFRIMP